MPPKKTLGIKDSWRVGGVLATKKIGRYTYTESQGRSIATKTAEKDSQYFYLRAIFSQTPQPSVGFELNFFEVMER